MAPRNFIAKVRIRSGNTEETGAIRASTQSLVDEMSRRVPGIQFQDDVVQPDEGTKGVIDIGMIAATLTATREAVRIFISAINAWVKRKQHCRISIEISGNKLEMSGGADSDQSKLVEAFLAKVLKE